MVTYSKIMHAMGTGVQCTYRFETCLPDQKNTKIYNKYLFFSYLLCKFAYQFFDKQINGGMV